MKNENSLLLSNSIINLSKSNISEAIKLIDTIKEDDIYQETIYQVAKNAYIDHEKLAIDLINRIIHNTKYFNGFRAYTGCIDNNEKAIDDMLTYKKITYDAGLLSSEEYIDILNEVVFSIAEYYPSKAKGLLEEINNVHVVIYEEGNDNDEVQPYNKNTLY